jgi:hypothetical protein
MRASARHRFVFFVGAFVGLFLLLVLAACRSKACVPGQQIACACPGGEQGAQVCDEDGSKYLPCACEDKSHAAEATVAPPPIARRDKPAPLLPQKQITCGSKICDVACCATFEPTCAKDGASCPRTETGEGVIFECDGPEDCGSSESCCLVPGDRTIAAVCVPRAECAGSYVHPRYKTKVTPLVVCHGNLDCGVSKLCTAKGGVAGLSTCQ